MSALNIAQCPKLYKHSVQTQAHSKYNRKNLEIRSSLLSLYMLEIILQYAREADHGNKTSSLFVLHTTILKKVTLTAKALSITKVNKSCSFAHFNMKMKN